MGEAESVLELRAAGEDRPARPSGQPQRLRARRRASAADHRARPRPRARPSRRNAYVIGRSCMRQTRRVGAAARARRRPPTRSARPRRCRWSSPAGAASRGRAGGAAGVYGSISPTKRLPGATAAGQRRRRAPRHEHDRPTRTGEQRPRPRPRARRTGAPLSRSRDHHRERLSSRCLRRAQRAHRVAVVAAQARW